MRAAGRPLVALLSLVQVLAAVVPAATATALALLMDRLAALTHRVCSPPSPCRWPPLVACYSSGTSPKQQLNHWSSQRCGGLR